MVLLIEVVSNLNVKEVFRPTTLQTLLETEHTVIDGATCTGTWCGPIRLGHLLNDALVGDGIDGDGARQTRHHQCAIPPRQPRRQRARHRGIVRL